MIKSFLLGLAAATSLTAPAAVQAQDIRGSVTIHVGDSPYRDYRYRNYDEYRSYYYRGPIFLDRYSGVYRCIRPNGRLGTLTTQWGMPITRYNAYRYYGTYNMRLRCR